jgi:hypothetical protein
MQTAICPLFHSHKTLPPARSPRLDNTQHPVAASPFRPTDTAKKQAAFRSKPVNFSPIPPHFSHAEAHFVRPSRPFTHAHTRTSSLFDFAFTRQANSGQITGYQLIAGEVFTLFTFTPEHRQLTHNQRLAVKDGVKVN